MNDCILWTGGVMNNGYGIVYLPGKRPRQELVHRHIWRECFGEIPANMHVHHKCRERLCINPDHLQLVTPSEHQRLERELRTHCRRGHEYAVYGRLHAKDGTRYCRACENENKRRRGDNGSYWRKRKAERDATLNTQLMAGG